MGHKTWLYHKDKAPQIFDSDDVQKLTEEGWRDSPEAAKSIENRKESHAQAMDSVVQNVAEVDHRKRKRYGYRFRPD